MSKEQAFAFEVQTPVMSFQVLCITILLPIRSRVKDFKPSLDKGNDVSELLPITLIYNGIVLYLPQNGPVTMLTRRYFVSICI